MKKFLTIVIVLLISSTFISAQKAGIAIGGNAYFPVGDWAEYMSTGWGGTIGYEHPIGKTTLGVIYSGYTAFSGTSEEEDYGLDNDWTMIPLLLGAKFYFSPKQNFYGAALLGVNFVTVNFSYTDIQGTMHEQSESTTEFAGNVLLGYEIKTGEKGALDLSAGFVWINEMSYFGARLGYIFKL